MEKTETLHESLDMPPSAELLLLTTISRQKVASFGNILRIIFCFCYFILFFFLILQFLHTTQSETQN